MADYTEDLDKIVMALNTEQRALLEKLERQAAICLRCPNPCQRVSRLKSLSFRQILTSPKVT